MAGSLQISGTVRAFAVVAVVLASGCFYTDSINQRPSVEIEQLSSAQVFRGDLVNLDAATNDPDGDDVSLIWHGYVCSDASPAPDGTRPGCDPSPRFGGNEKLFSFDVPGYRQDGTTPVGAMFVTLDAVDSEGATAKPGQELIIPVGDAPPTVTLAAEQRGDNVVGIPVSIFGKIGDPDDGPSVLAVTWTAFSPSGSETLATDGSTPVDGNQLQVSTTLVPDVVGQWTVQLAATDPSDATTMQTLSITIGDDQPPCLGTWTPAVPPPTDTLPISAATLFQVLVVDDDLDPYPAMPGDPMLGTTTFAWSLLPPGGSTRESIGSASTASVALDPASYQPGDVVELRVEIFDRDPMHAPLPCADTDPTCSIGANACNQRLTWRVEIQ